MLVARAEADVQKGERLAGEFLHKIAHGPNGKPGNTELAAVAQSQAYFVVTNEKLGILAANANFFEFNPYSAHHKVRAVMFNFNDGPEQLQLMLNAYDRGTDFLWVNYALNASSTNFDDPTPATVARPSSAPSASAAAT